MRSIYFDKHMAGVKVFSEEMPATKHFEIVGGKGVLRVRWEFEVEDVGIDPELAEILGIEVREATGWDRLKWAFLGVAAAIRNVLGEIRYSLFGKLPVISDDEWDQNVVYHGEIMVPESAREERDERSG
jgi:hypothetical protein